MAKESMKPKTTGKGFAWLCDFGLCYWVVPDLNKLKPDGKPSPEAKAVKVRIVLEKDYQQLIKHAHHP